MASMASEASSVKSDVVDEQLYQIKDFYGSSDILIKDIQELISPTDTQIKINIVNCKCFPTNIKYAKTLGKQWSDKFKSFPKFKGKYIHFFFDLKEQMLTITINEDGVYPTAPAASESASVVVNKLEKKKERVANKEEKDTNEKKQEYIHSYTTKEYQTNKTWKRQDFGSAFFYFADIYKKIRTL